MTRTGRNLFRLTEEQFARIKSCLPTDIRGVPRVDDRRVISGIIHVLLTGTPLRAAPKECGPGRTLLLPPVGGEGHLESMLPSLADKEFRSRLSLTARPCLHIAPQEVEKGGAQAVHRAFAWWPHDQYPPRDRRLRAALADCLEFRPVKRFSSHETMPGAPLGCAGSHRREGV